jgi:ADP-ribose pyrophosphatase
MEQNGPWTTVRKEERYATPWIAVSHHDVIDPAGQPGVYGVVHFRNRAVGIVPLDEEGHTWIVGQHRYPIGRYSWEIPEGGAPRDQAPLASAQRELKEETGITARRWTEILQMDLSNSASDEEAIVYVAQDLSFGEAEPESTEDLTVRRLPFAELLAMVMRGEVRDAISIAAVLKVHHLLSTGELTLQK